METLKGKIVCVTGASSGIGASCAKRFAAAGAKMILVARRLGRLAELEQVLKQAYHCEVLTLELDVSKQQEVARVFSTLPHAWREINVLINNAGLARGLSKIDQGEIQDWEEMIDTNVKGLLYVTRAILPAMVQSKSGHVINIGSIAGHEVYPNGGVYCATKHAVDAITKGLRIDTLGSGVRVSTVDPGMVETEFSLVRFRGDAARAQATYSKFTPLRPEDVADAVFYCATVPTHVNISEIIIMPTAQATATHHLGRTT